MSEVFYGHPKPTSDGRLKHGQIRSKDELSRGHCSLKLSGRSPLGPAMVTRMRSRQHRYLRFSFPASVLGAAVLVTVFAVVARMARDQRRVESQDGRSLLRERVDETMGILVDLRSEFTSGAWAAENRRTSLFQNWQSRASGPLRGHLVLTRDAAQKLAIDRDTKTRLIGEIQGAINVCKAGFLKHAKLLYSSDPADAIPVVAVLDEIGFHLMNVLNLLGVKSES